MKVILTSNMGRLGSHGDEIAVKPGFARNYLIPQGLAVQVLRGNDKLNEHRRKLYESKRKAEIEANKALAERLKGIELSVTASASKSGRLFGSITPKMLLDEIKKKGIEIDKKNFNPTASIRQLGVHTLTVKLHSQVTVNIKVTVNSDAPVQKKEKKESVVQEAGAENSAADTAAPASSEAPATSVGSEPAAEASAE